MAYYIPYRSPYHLRPPSRPAVINYDSPLAQGLTFYVPFWALRGHPIDLISRATATVSSTATRGVTGARSTSYFSGSTAVAATAATTNRLEWVDTLPTGTCTIGARYRKFDATNRNSGAFGTVNSGTYGTRANVHLPYSNGQTYWDYAGASGTQRVNVGGLTFGADAWIFIAEPGVYGSIVQNGITRASKTWGSATRTVDWTGYRLHGYGSLVSDVAEFSDFAVWDRRLSEAEIEIWTFEGRSLMTSTGARTFFLPSVAVAATGQPSNRRGSGVPGMRQTPGVW